MTSQAAFGPPFFRWCRVKHIEHLRDPIYSTPALDTRKCSICFTRHLPIVIAAALASGCATERLYEGERLPATQAALVRADPVVSAGSPVQVRIRRVDGREIGLSTSRVELPPGPHEILVDCRVAESGAMRRFTVAAQLEPGRRYRLVAETTARNCEAVRLVDD